MPMLYIRTDHIGPHPVCCWKDEPPPEDDEGTLELVAETDDVDLAIRVFEKLKEKLQRQALDGEANEGDEGRELPLVLKPANPHESAPRQRVPRLRPRLSRSKRTPRNASRGSWTADRRSGLLPWIHIQADDS